MRATIQNRILKLKVGLCVTKTHFFRVNLADLIKKIALRCSKLKNNMCLLFIWNNEYVSKFIR